MPNKNVVEIRKDIMVNNFEKTREKIANDTEEDLLSNYLNSSNPVFVINRKGEFTDVNDAFCQKIGIKSENVLGRNIGDVSFLTEESRKEASLRHVSRLLGKETPVYKLDVITKRGDVVSLEIDTKSLVKKGRITGEISILRKATITTEDKWEKKAAKKFKKVPKQEIKENIELLNAMKKIKQKDSEISRLRSELNERDTDLKAYKKEWDRLNERWKASELDIGRSESEIEQLEDEIDRIQHRLKLREREIDDLRQELRVNKLKLEEKNGNAREIKKKLEQKQEELTEKEKDLIKKDEKIKPLQTELNKRIEDIQKRMKYLMI